MQYEEIVAITQNEIQRYLKRMVSRASCPNCRTSPMVILEIYKDDDLPPDRVLKCLNCHKSFFEKLEEVKDQRVTIKQ